MIKWFLLLTLCVMPALGEIIPSDRRVDWPSLVGATKFTPSGTHVSRGIGVSLAQLNTDMAAAPDYYVVQLSDTGIYDFTAGGNLQANSRVILRGMGPGTIVKLGGEFRVGAGIGYARTKIAINSGSTTGSTTVTLASAPTGLVVGRALSVSEVNDEDFVHPYGYELGVADLTTYADEQQPSGEEGTRARAQMVLVTAINGNDVTFSPALLSTFSSSPKVEYATSAPIQSFGLENLTIDVEDGIQYGVNFEGTLDCWMTDVKVIARTAEGPAVRGYWSYRTTINRCQFEGADPLSSAIVTSVNSEGWLIMDNSFDGLNQVWITQARHGVSAFLYNYVHTVTASTTAMIADVGTHGPHAQWILYEGNKIFKLHADCIHGSSSHGTIFRNYIRGRESDSTYGFGMVNIDMWNSYYNVVGNVLGDPGLGSEWIYEEDAATAPDPDVSKAIYAFNYAGYDGTVDLGRIAKSTVLRHGNIDWSDTAGQVVWDAGIADHTIPASMFFTEKPSWFGSLPYPSIGPDVTGYYTNVIPAEYRFLNGTEVPEVSSGGRTAGGKATIGGKVSF